MSIPNIKIAVAFHRPAEVDDYIKNNNIYVPIYSGNDWKTNMLNDSSAPSCADLNPEINEITQLYWLASRLDQFGDPDYIGCHHYRRFLNFDIHNLNPNTIQATWFSLKYLSVASQLTLFESSRKKAESFFNTYLSFFPQDIQLFNQYLCEHWFYACNLFIMPKEIFKEYYQFMKFLIDLSYFYKRNNPQIFEKRPRILSMYFQRMTGFFIYKKQRQGVKINNCPIITPEKYFKYITQNIYTGNYFTLKNNYFYRVNKTNYILKEL